MLASQTNIINHLIKCVQNSNCSRRAQTQWQLPQPSMLRTSRDLFTQEPRIATPERSRKPLRSRPVHQEAPSNTSHQGHTSNIKTRRAATQLLSCRKSLRRKSSPLRLKMALLNLLNKRLRVLAPLKEVSRVHLRASTQTSRSSPSTTLDTVAQATAATAEA